jgi:hypothetical protein
MRKPLAIALASLLLVMSLTSVAFAQSSVNGYTPDEGAVQNQIQGNDDTGTPPNATQESNEPGAQPSATPRAATPSDDSDSLPFTGLDLALLAGAGAVLLSLGLGMRRLTQAPESV